MFVSWLAQLKQQQQQQQQQQPQQQKEKSCWFPLDALVAQKKEDKIIWLQRCGPMKNGLLLNEGLKQGFSTQASRNMNLLQAYYMLKWWNPGTL